MRDQAKSETDPFEHRQRRLRGSGLNGALRAEAGPIADPHFSPG